jgi:hypothetical protein
MKKIHRNIMTIMGLAAVALMTITLIASVQINRDLERMLEDVREMESRSIQMNEEAEALLKELINIHPPEQESP